MKVVLQIHCLPTGGVQRSCFRHLEVLDKISWAYVKAAGCRFAVASSNDVDAHLRLAEAAMSLEPGDPGQAVSR